MKHIYTILGLILIASCSIYAAKQTTYKVTKGGTLQMKLYHGDIRIEIWDRDEVKVSADDEFYRGMKVNQSSSKINITSTTYGDEDLVVTIPNKFNLELMTSGGDIRVRGNVDGDVKAGTAGGDLVFEHIYGNAELTTGGGDIRCNYIKGNAKINSAGGDLRFGNIDGTLDMKTSGGDITLETTNKLAKISTAGGTIRIKHVNRDAKIETFGGDIRVNYIGGKASLSTGGGDIEVHESKSELIVKSMSGDVKLHKVHSAIHGNVFAGDIWINIVSGYKGDTKLMSSTGDVHLGVSPDAKVDITAIYNTSTHYGRDYQEVISSDFPVTRYTKEDHNDEAKTIYSLNNGGSNVEVRVQNGEVRIFKK